MDADIGDVSAGGHDFLADVESLWNAHGFDGDIDSSFSGEF